MTRAVAILADDLTGALDAAAPFANPEAPIEVIWGRGRPDGPGGFAIDSETREASAPAAEAVMRELIPCLLARQLPFKKIDSLLRGNTFQEIAACCLSGAFGSVVVAPAFPAQHRITRLGRQHERVADGWRAAGPDLAEALAELGVKARRILTGGHPVGGGVMICDAEDAADLARIAASGGSLEQPILWCGSAGLARALASSGREPIVPAGKSVLAIVGSRHPNSFAQVARLREAMPDAVVALTSSADADAAIVGVEERLRRGQAAVLAFDMPPLASGSADALFRRSFVRLAEAEPPEHLVVAGGSTLVGLCQALGAERLFAIGEWRPGIAVSRLGGGRWHGTTVVSKSGAFGDRDLLADLFASAKGQSG